MSTIVENKTDVRSANPRKLKTVDWLIIGGLMLLSLLPVLAGSIRVAELSAGAEITPANERFFASPVPVVVHIIGASLYSVLGALQFSPGLRRQRRRWHRMAGRLLIPAGFAAALTGLWMAHFYPWPPGDGNILYVMRLVFGAGMVLSLVLGTLALRRRDYNQHSAWMVRAYAIGIGAGTQVFTHLPWLVLMGNTIPDEGTRAVMMGAGWVINIIVAEWIIQRRMSPSRRRAVVAPRPL